MINQCSACGLYYKVDLLIPDRIWKQIKPEQGNLCGACIMKRLEALDIDVVFLNEQKCDCKT